jgi:potassium-transporting ATPase KdpC subunit
MLASLRSATVAIVLCTLVFGLAYPLVVTGVGQLVFPGAADGSLVKRDGKTVGSSLIGQSFQKPVLDRAGKPKVDADGNAVTEPDPRYLQPRPSATGYSADATYFANRGPNSKIAAYAYRDAVAGVLALERPYVPGLKAGDLPPDAVENSASGVDPHISPAYADLQSYRIARERGIPRAKVLSLIDDNTDDRALGVFGRPGVNVLEFNLALDREAPAR